MKTVLHILGLGYSGSSLLNLLLDAQPRIRGIGEAIYLATASKSPCHACRKPAAECALRPLINPQRFYGSFFDAYGDCDVIVDASKRPEESLWLHPPEAGTEHAAVVLAKEPAEWAYSFVKHHPWHSPARAIDDWFATYGRIDDRVQCPKRWLMYRDLATDPARTARSICDWLGTPFDSGADCWAPTDTHVYGGNRIIAAAAAGDRAPFVGKYAGRFREIFYDDAWERDQSFLRQCERELGNRQFGR